MKPDELWLWVRWTSCPHAQQPITFLPSSINVDAQNDLRVARDVRASPEKDGHLQLDDRLNGSALERNLMDALEEWELIRNALILEHNHHVLGRDGALQL